GVEQGREGVAQAEAAATAVTDVEDALEFLLERRLVDELRLAPIERMARGSLQAPFAYAGVRRAHAMGQIASSAFWKRLACERSAFASVSNQSAISENPSSRACLAMPGYMSLYSCVSPAMAALRFALVSPIGSPVAGSPTASRYSRWPCA